ncbi:hypothetical protein M434DRAFT_34359 [Hypoxylon sp. CO27-5]|nr:hypothetical protein M434DRAFT_34359 [Hypoxylon sp. CO27-5]QZS37063.1 C147A protein [Hypoxylon sp. CO27-5]
MAPVTEFVQSTLKPGIPLEPLYKAFEKVKAASGNRVVRASPLHDNPEQFRLFIDWDSIDAHLAFRTTDAYKDFMAEIAPYVAGPAVVVHLDLTPFPPTVLDKSPVTEVFQMYFDPSADEAKNLAAAKKVAADIAAGGFAGATGLSAVGWTVEKDVEHKGEKTRVLTALIGWESVEAHTAALESDAFKKITSYFQTGTDGIKGYDMSYVSLKAI